MGFFSSIGNFLKDNVGSVLGFAGDVAGGLLGLSGTKSTNKTEAQLAQAQMAYQKELAQNQIQWRVEDAKKAGLHPLAALGVSSASYSPVSTSLESPDYSFLGDMGQNLNRAIQQGKTQKEREQALARQNQYDDIMMRKANAEADLAETTAASERLRLQRELFPPSPVANTKDDPQLNTGLESPSGSAYHVWNMGNGEYDILMNPDYQQTIGDEFGQVATTLKAVTRAKSGVWVNPEDGISYVYNPDSGYFRRLSSLSDEEARRLLGNSSSGGSSGSSSGSHFERNRHRYRY